MAAAWGKALTFWYTPHPRVDAGGGERTESLLSFATPDK